jgi:tryptophan synthase alpha chain
MTPRRIDAIFSSAREQRRKLLMPFVCAGSPRADSTVAVLTALDRAGAGIIEVGIPFSDPIADGPVIAAAMHEALLAGVTPAKVFEQVALARPNVSCGLVAMVSVSLVYRIGLSRFVAEAKAAGFDGFIFPDAPLEESGDLAAASTQAGLTCSLLIAPTTPPDRAEVIARVSTGFLYLLARAGITGERSDAPTVGPRVASLRKATALPIACGFGISTAEHVSAVCAHADAAIVGSALVRRLKDAQTVGQDVAKAAGDFVMDLSTGLVDMHRLMS